MYAHLELKGNPLSEAQMKMLKMYDDKKKKEEEELSKKDKVSSMITKDSVKKEDEKEEEKPDMRSKYAMINLIKNKLRSAGQRDPMVMAVDACEERTPAKDDPSFSQEYKDNAKKGIEASKKKKPVISGAAKAIGTPPYNPYGKGATANPSNMSGSTGP